MKKITSRLAVIVVLLAFTRPALAQRHKMLFTGGTSTDWFTVTNWTRDGVLQTSAGVLPQNGDSIVITNQNAATACIAGLGVHVYLNNVLIYVQPGANLVMGNGVGGSSPSSTSGTLELDSPVFFGAVTSAISLEYDGTNRGRISANTPTTNIFTIIIIGSVTKFRGSTWEYNLNPGSGWGVITGPAHADASTGSGLSSFSGGALPIVLLGFNANLTAGNKVNIEWITQQEISTDHFSVERSNDGASWETLVKVKASGFSSMPKMYSCSDVAPKKGINLYRLRMIDFDGNYEYSDIVRVRVNLQGKISLFPNPSTNSVTVSLGEVPASDWTVSLVSTSGQVMLQKRLGKDLNTVSLLVSIYPSGNYMVEISDGVFIQNFKLLIAH